MHRALYIVGLMLLTSICLAQKTFQPRATNLEYKGIIYRKEKSVDIRLHTNGFALAYNTGRIDAFNKTTYYHFELGYAKDFREKRQSRNIINATGLIESSTFTYGKRNNLLVLRAGRGWKRYLSEKARRRGIAMGYSYEVGPSIALLKPYYLSVIEQQVQGNEVIFIEKDISYDEENKELFLDYEQIVGTPGYFKGFGDLSITPGIQAKGGLLFSLGAYDKMVKAVEIGAMVDIYAKKLPILVETEAVSNKPYIFNLYLSLQLGKRSN